MKFPEYLTVLNASFCPVKGVITSSYNNHEEIINYHDKALGTQCMSELYDQPYTREKKTTSPHMKVACQKKVQIRMFQCVYVT